MVHPRAQDDDAPVAFEISTVGEKHVSITECNHTANGGRSTAPSEGSEDLQSNSGVLQQVQGRCGQYSKNPKGTVEAKPCHIRFYPILWMQLLETAKVEMWCSLFRQHSFLSDKQTTVDGE